MSLLLDNNIDKTIDYNLFFSLYKVDLSTWRTTNLVFLSFHKFDMMRGGSEGDDMIWSMSGGSEGAAIPTGSEEEKIST